MDELATSIIIPKDNPDIAASIAKCKPGEKVTIEAEVTGNDETGLTVEVYTVTPDYAKKTKVKAESPTEYAKKMRRQRMAGGQMAPMMETEEA